MSGTPGRIIVPKYQNGLFRPAHEGLRDASQQQPPRTASSVCADHDDVGVAFFGSARKYL